MISILKKLLKSERGDMGIYVMLIMLITVTVVIVAAIAFVWRFWIIKNHVAEGLHEALIQAADDAGSYSVQYQYESGSNQMVINKDEAQTVFNSFLPLNTGLTSNQYTLEYFEVYGPTDQGKPLPGGVPGVVPGTAIYAMIQVDIPVGDIVGMPKLSRQVLYMPISDMVSPNRFHNSLGQWQGG
ncbi:MAG: hypothetical protein M0Z41_05185 [Peptococcaceae bacterium]|jgi:hypothetical protein|nr:hypothetical protein [Peptococcaceae bacterium]